MRDLSRRRHWLAAVPLVLIAGSALAGPAPAQLRGKSILASWGETGLYKRVYDGASSSYPGKFSWIIYVSEAGRPFLRGGGVNGPNGRGFDAGPEKGGGSVSFNGNSLSATDVNSGVARRLSVTFDPAFTSCSGTVTIGKTGPRAQLKGFDGAMYEVISMQSAAFSCSIQAGNALTR